MRPLPFLVRKLPRAADPPARMLALHARHPDRYPVLLESAATSPALGRYSLLLAAPGGRLQLDDSGQLSGPGRGDRFCERLDDWWRAEPKAAPPDPWPFAGGWFLYLGYELASEVEPTLRLPPSPLPVVACAWRMQAVLAHDHRTGRTAVIAEPEAATVADALAWDWAQETPALAPAGLGPGAEVAEDEPGRYLEACRRALLHIAAGDVYQANLARSWRARLPGGTPAAGG